MIYFMDVRLLDDAKMNDFLWAARGFASVSLKYKLAQSINSDLHNVVYSLHINLL